MNDKYCPSYVSRIHGLHAHQPHTLHSSDPLPEDPHNTYCQSDTTNFQIKIKIVLVKNKNTQIQKENNSFLRVGWVPRGNLSTGLKYHSPTHTHTHRHIDTHTLHLVNSIVPISSLICIFSKNLKPPPLPRLSSPPVEYSYSISYPLSLYLPVIIFIHVII